MPSHTDEDPKKLLIVPKWIKDWHVKGNNVAEDMAGTAVGIRCVPPAQAVPRVQVSDNSDIIAKR